MRLDSDGGLWLAGDFTGSGLSFGGDSFSADGGRSLFLARLDARADAGLGHLSSVSLPASNDARIRALGIDGRGSPIVAGTFTGALDLGTGALLSSDAGVFVGRVPPR